MSSSIQTPYPLEWYLRPSELLDFDHPAVAALAARLRRPGDYCATARAMFEWVRDDIRHSGDIGSSRVTCSASEVLRFGEGICFAKAHLLAALLRCAGIPAGLCYQRLTRDAKPESGYCLHGLNALYLASEERWVRLDPRGNKPGVEALFSLGDERVAFPIHPELGEVDYPTNHPQPHPAVVAALEASRANGFGPLLSEL
jgi:transglutaminase-like putative cysteine protease